FLRSNKKCDRLDLLLMLLRQDIRWTLFYQSQLVLQQIVAGWFVAFYKQQLQVLVALCDSPDKESPKLLARNYVPFSNHLEKSTTYDIHQSILQKTVLKNQKKNCV